MSFEVSDFKNLSQDNTTDFIINSAWNDYEEKIAPVYDKAIRVEKYVLLKQMDTIWADHIAAMANLKSGINLRGYAQSNPTEAYAKEGFALYENALKNVVFSVVNFCNSLKINFE